MVATPLILLPGHKRGVFITLPILRFFLSDRHKNAKIFENKLISVMCYSLDCSQRVLSDGYPYVRVSVIFQVSCMVYVVISNIFDENFRISKESYSLDNLCIHFNNKVMKTNPKHLAKTANFDHFLYCQGEKFVVISGTDIEYLPTCPGK